MNETSLLKLLNGYAEESLNEDQARELRDILNVDIQSRRLFWEFMEQEFLLQEIFAEKSGQAAAMREMEKDLIGYRQGNLGTKRSKKLGSSVSKVHFLSLALAASVVFLIGLLLFFIPPKGETYRVGSLQGDAWILRGTESLQIHSGMPLRPADQVHTGNASILAIHYEDGTTVRLLADTFATLSPTPKEPNQGGKRLLLTRGKVSAHVVKQPPAQPMIIATPNANATIVGTSFLITATDAATELEVQEGSVNLTRLSHGDTVRVSAGEFAIAAVDLPLKTALVRKDRNLAPKQPPQILFQESFDDQDFVTRDWYDNTQVATTETEHAPGSRGSAEFHFPAGSSTPTSGGPMRILFEETESVYLSYRIKYDTNYIGSDQRDSIQEFLFLTNKDKRLSGLSSTHLTAAIEQNEGAPVLWLHDAKNMDLSRLGQDLTAVTEDRSIAGGNGISPAENPSGTTLYEAEGDEYRNGKSFRADQAHFQRDVWHHVEVVFRLNTLSEGKANPDGILQYWLDGKLIIERTNVIMRTGKHPDMKFNQFVIAPFIAGGSPVDQSFWLDELTVATARP